MKEILLFGGTSEGRKIAQALVEKGISVVVCVATEEGKKELRNLNCLSILVGRMGIKEIRQLICESQCSYIIDATHPYAKEITNNIKQAVFNTDCKLIRIIRESIWDKDCQYFSTIKDVVIFLKNTTGNILLTTGSKELDIFREIPDYEKRCYIRVLLADNIKQHCLSLGFLGSHILLKKGPFSIEENKDHIRWSKADYLVTKESGIAGGFIEKIQSAKEENIVPLVIKRPTKENGMFLEQALEWIKKIENRKE